MASAAVDDRPLTADMLAAHLAEGCKPESQFRVGAEHEKFVFRLGSHAPVPYEPQGIKALLEDHVKPAVEMDGGAIQFKNYDNGVVTVMLQGSCSGCPSSMITLKAGIEGMMKRMIPEVTEVVAEAE